MRVARRVPWPSLEQRDSVVSALERVVLSNSSLNEGSRLLSAGNGIGSRVRVMRWLRSTLTSWIHRSRPSPSVEATLALLSALLLVYDNDSAEGSGFEHANSDHCNDRRDQATRSDHDIPLICDSSQTQIPSFSSYSTYHSSLRTSHHATRLSLSMALTRLVNHSTDHHQTALYARSIAAIASDIQLPTYLVDLRHSATHDTLPPLTVLVSAGERALKWVVQKYWVFQVENDGYGEISLNCNQNLGHHAQGRLEALIQPFWTRYFLKKLGIQDRHNCLDHIVNILPMEAVATTLVPMLVQAMDIDVGDESSASLGKREKLGLEALKYFSRVWNGLFEDVILSILEGVIVESEGDRAQIVRVSWMKTLLSDLISSHITLKQQSTRKVFKRSTPTPPVSADPPEYLELLRDVITSCLYASSNESIDELLAHIRVLVVRVGSPLRPLLELMDQFDADQDEAEDGDEGEPIQGGTTQPSLAMKDGVEGITELPPVSLNSNKSSPSPRKFMLYTQDPDYRSRKGWRAAPIGCLPGYGGCVPCLEVDPGLKHIVSTTTNVDGGVLFPRSSAERVLRII